MVMSRVKKSLSHCRTKKEILDVLHDIRGTCEMERQRLGRLTVKDLRNRVYRIIENENTLTVIARQARKYAERRTL